MTRVLFLDDDDHRHRAFARNAIDHDLVAVRSYDEAATVLAELVAGTIAPFDQIFLDHDLSLEAAMGTPTADEKTGLDVARLVAALDPAKRPEFVVIHSYNRAGALRMRAVLEDAGLYPAICSPFDGKRTAPLRSSSTATSSPRT